MSHSLCCVLDVQWFKKNKLKKSRLWALASLSLLLVKMQTTSNCTITLSHECKEGKDQVPGKRLFVVDEVLPEDQVFWDQKAEEEPAK